MLEMATGITTTGAALELRVRTAESSSVSIRTSYKLPAAIRCLIAYLAEDGIEGARDVASQKTLHGCSIIRRDRLHSLL
jgi:hypothetical protein